MPNTEFDRRYRQLAFWTVSAVTIVAAFILVQPFIGAILWATVLSVLMWPVYRRLRKTFSENVSAAVAVLATLGAIILPLSLVGILVYVQASQVAIGLEAAAPVGADRPTVTQATDAIDQVVRPLLERVGVDFSVGDWLQANRSELSSQVTGPIGRAAFTTVSTFLTLVIALLTMFFMLRDGHRLLDPALELIPLPRSKSLEILERMRATIQAVFIGVVLVALIQGTAAGILYKFTGVPSPFLWALITTVLCVIPLLGSPVIYLPLALMLAAQGEYVRAIVLAGVGLAFISQIDNILRPFVIGARINLHPMGVFFSLLGGVLAMGPVGLMAGPVLLTVLLALQDVIRERRQLGESEA